MDLERREIQRQSVFFQGRDGYGTLAARVTAPRTHTVEERRETLPKVRFAAMTVGNVEV